MSFGLAVAVGLTPQMLPMIVTANLSRSVRIMRAKKTAIRRMDAIQNLGAMCGHLTPHLPAHAPLTLEASKSLCTGRI